MLVLRKQTVSEHDPTLIPCTALSPAMAPIAAVAGGRRSHSGAVHSLVDTTPENGEATWRTAVPDGP
jgi:hypothetical protein